MNPSTETGNNGEELATQWLAARGYAILERNWRWRHCEIDIIASKGDTLHFVEVKTRTKDGYGQPENKVGGYKLQKMKQGAEEYLHRQPQWKWIQFDILSVKFFNNGHIEYFFIEDAF